MFEKHKLTIVLMTAVLVLCLVFWSGTALAGGGFAIPWWTIDSGGGSSQGGDFVVNGTLGQPDARVISGGEYTLNGGFWGVAVSPSDKQIFLPMVVR